MYLYLNTPLCHLRKGLSNLKDLEREITLGLVGVETQALDQVTIKLSEIAPLRILALVRALGELCHFHLTLVMTKGKRETPDLDLGSSKGIRVSLILEVRKTTTTGPAPGVKTTIATNPMPVASAKHPTNANPNNNPKSQNRAALIGGATTTRMMRRDSRG